MTLPSFGSAPGHQLHLAAELGHVPQRACDLVGERHVRRRHPPFSRLDELEVQMARHARSVPCSCYSLGSARPSREDKI